MSRSGEVRLRLSLDGKLLGPPSLATRIRSLLAAGELERLHVTFVPCIVGGAATPTLLGPPLASLLQKSVKLRLERMQQKGARCEAVYAVMGRGKFASAPVVSRVKKKACKRATRKTSLSAT
jgi:hypothetical protein